MVDWSAWTTERLELRRLSMDDLDDLASLHAEESFWRYPFGRGWSKPETEAFLERTIARYDDPGHVAPFRLGSRKRSPLRRQRLPQPTQGSTVAPPQLN